MNLDPALKIIANLSLIALFSSCAPTSNSINDYQGLNTDDSTIVGGILAPVEFEMKNGIIGLYDLEKGGLCTGSLIGKGLVLTAGHCVNVAHPEKMIIFFGPNFKDIIKQVREGNPTNIRSVVKVVRHENYKLNTPETPDVAGQSANDIALVRFQGENVKGFEMASLADSTQSDMLKQGTLLMLAGYGVSEFKQDPKTGAALSSKGSGVLRQVDKIEVLSILPTGEEIEIDQSKGHGACHGDSGGPAYLTDIKTNKNYVVGVTSRGGGDCNITAVYTSVLGYAQWIQKHSASLMQ